MALYFFLGLFIFSSIALVAMFAYRSWEIRRGKIILRDAAPRFLSFPQIAQLALHGEKLVHREGQRHFARLFEETQKRAKKALDRDVVRRGTVRVADAVRGKRALTQNTSTSSFLKTLTEQRDRLKNSKK